MHDTTPAIDWAFQIYKGSRSKMKYLKRAMSSVLLTGMLVQPAEAQRAVPRNPAAQPAAAQPVPNPAISQYRHYLPQTTRPNGVGPGEQGYVGNNPLRWELDRENSMPGQCVVPVPNDEPWRI